MFSSSSSWELDVFIWLAVLNTPLPPGSRNKPDNSGNSKTRQPTIRYLLHDHDAEFPPPFDQVFAAQQIEVIRTPIRAPNANAYAERWVRSVRQECFNHLLIVNEHHLNSVLQECSNYYKRRRPHQGSGQHFPETDSEPPAQGAVRRRDVLGGIIHDYHRDAA